LLEGSWLLRFDSLPLDRDHGDRAAGQDTRDRGSWREIFKCHREPANPGLILLSRRIPYYLVDKLLRARAES
jgi:hypothetical protein